MVWLSKIVKLISKSVTNEENDIFSMGNGSLLLFVMKLLISTFEIT